MSHGRQSLGHQLLGNISSSIAERKTQCLCYAMSMSVLPDTGSALAVQQFLALRLAAQDSEKNQRHIRLPKIRRILVLTLKKGFQALLLQILYAAFREQEKRPSIPQLRVCG